MRNFIVKVLCVGSISDSNETFKKALNAGLEVEWGTAETEEEATSVEQFYDYIIVTDGIIYSSEKCISFQEFIKPDESICF